MSAFDLPPSTPPVSFDPPPGGRRSRKRTAVVAVASLGLVAAAVVVVTQLTSDGESEPVANAAVDAESIGVIPPTPAPTTTPPADDRRPEGGDDGDDAGSGLDGEIVIRIEGQEPIVIDLGDLGDLGHLPQLDELPDIEIPAPGEWGSLPPLPELGELGDLGDLGDLDFGKLEECVGGSWSAFPHGPGRFPRFPGGVVLGADGENVTIAGADGVSVVDWGEGDGSVTITRKDGEITIRSDGDVEVDDLADAIQPPEDASGSAGADDVPPPSLPDFQQVFDCLHGDAAD